MGKSAKWRVETPLGERTVRVLHATHGPRVRIFVDENLVFERTDGDTIWDSGFEYAFEVDGVHCCLEIRSDRNWRPHPTLFVAGRGLPPSR